MPRKKVVFITLCTLFLVPFFNVQAQEKDSLSLDKLLQMVEALQQNQEHLLKLRTQRVKDSLPSFFVFMARHEPGRLVVAPETGRFFIGNRFVIKQHFVFGRDFKGGRGERFAVHFNAARLNQFLGLAPRGYA